MLAAMANPKRFIRDPREMDAAVSQALAAADAPAALRKLAWETQWGPKWRGEWRCCAAPMTEAAAMRIYAAFPGILGEAFAPHLRGMGGKGELAAAMLNRQAWDAGVMNAVMAGGLVRVNAGGHVVGVAKMLKDAALEMPGAQLCEIMAMTYGLKWEIQSHPHACRHNPLTGYFWERPLETWLGNSETIRAMLTARGVHDGSCRMFVVERAHAALASRDPRAPALAAEHVGFLLRGLGFWSEPSPTHEKALLAAACDEKAAQKILTHLHSADWALALKAQILHMHPNHRKPSEQPQAYRWTA